MKRYEGLPLVHQPGERWLYDTGSQILGVLIARVSGKTLGAFLGERIFEPLGMKDTGFSVPEAEARSARDLLLDRWRDRRAPRLRRRARRPLRVPGVRIRLGRAGLHGR